MPADRTVAIKWRAPTRAELEGCPPGTRFSCACGRQARADELYPVHDLAAFPGDWACEGCIGTARGRGRIVPSALLAAWRAPAAAIEHVQAAERIEAERLAAAREAPDSAPGASMLPSGQE